MTMEYIYILKNSKVRGHCKVGMTTTAPSKRCDEINRTMGTGGIGSWVVAYHARVKDCRAAEKKAHNALAAHHDKRGHGTATEIFDCAPITAAETTRQTFCWRVGNESPTAKPFMNADELRAERKAEIAAQVIAIQKNKDNKAAQFPASERDLIEADAALYTATDELNALVSDTAAGYVEDHAEYKKEFIAHCEHLKDCESIRNALCVGKKTFDAALEVRLAKKIICDHYKKTLAALKKKEAIERSIAAMDRKHVDALRMNAKHDLEQRQRKAENAEAAAHNDIAEKTNAWVGIRCTLLTFSAGWAWLMMIVVGDSFFWYVAATPICIAAALLIMKISTYFGYGFDETRLKPI